MTDAKKRKILYDFIKKQKIAVVSTVNKAGDPEAAVVEFGETEDLELVFDTLKTYRKYKNLKRNQKVAFVIGWDENITVQYEGEAHEIQGKDLDKYQKAYFAKNPEAQRWGKVEGIVYYRVIPKWIRYSDLRTKPWKIFEVKF